MMRIQNTDLDAVKLAAKLLARFSPNISHSQCLESISKASGFRDFHDLQGESRNRTTVTSEIPFETAMTLLLKVADSLNLQIGDVQYALTKSGFLSSNYRDLELQIRLYLAALRLGNRIGAVVNTVNTTSGFTKKPGYLTRSGRATDLLFDTVMGLRANYQVRRSGASLDDSLPVKLWLPYGYWILEDGSEVLFSRDYKPLWKVTGAKIERLDPWATINEVEHRYHFATGGAAWYSGSAREAALHKLAEHRIVYLPKLANVMPLLFEEGIEFIDMAVEKLQIMTEHKIAELV